MFDGHLLFLGSWYVLTYYLYYLLIITLAGLDTTVTADVQGPILNSLGEIQKKVSMYWSRIYFLSHASMNQTRGGRRGLRNKFNLR